MITLFFSCTAPSVCDASAALQKALEERLGKVCADIDAQKVESLHLGNWSEPLHEEPVLGYFTNLKVLRLSDTQIVDISFVAKLPKLEILHLDHSNVEDISPLHHTPHLREKFLSYSLFQQYYFSNRPTLFFSSLPADH